MRKNIAIIVVLLAVMVPTTAVLARLLRGYGSSQSVTCTAATRIEFGGQATSVILDNGTGGTVYYAYNCSTGQWATIYTATNGCVLPASTQHVLPADVGPYASVTLQAAACTTSTVAVTGL